MRLSLVLVAVVSSAITSSTEAAASTGIADTGALPLNLRSDPNTSANTLAAVPSGTTLTLNCWTTGETVSGKYGSSSLWHMTTYAGAIGFVTDTWVNTGINGPAPGEPPCEGPPPGPPYADGNGGTLNLRSQPTSASNALASIPDLTHLDLACWADGESVNGKWGTGSTWHRTSYAGQTGYVSDPWLFTGVNGPMAGEPSCSSDNPVATSPPPQSDPPVLPAVQTPAPISSLPTVNPISPQAAPQESCETPAGIQIGSPNFLSTALFTHYVTGNGAAVVFDWSLLSGDNGFVTEARTLAVGQNNVLYTPPLGDLFFAIGTFSVSRLSEHCYSIFDNYDFTPDKESNKKFFPFWALQLVGARTFEVRAAGSLP